MEKEYKSTHNPFAKRNYQPQHTGNMVSINHGRRIRRLMQLRRIPLQQAINEYYEHVSTAQANRDHARRKAEADKKAKELEQQLQAGNADMKEKAAELNVKHMSMNRKRISPVAGEPVKVDAPPKSVRKNKPKKNG